MTITGLIEMQMPVAFPGLKGRVYPWRLTRHGKARERA
jgi:hypothetical protein